MENIIEPNESFDFSKLSLAHPVGIQGGAYFTKIEYNKKPLYIQTTKSLTRQAFVKTGKKYYCDLMFDKNAESLINWLENLEEKCHKLIYDKKDDWFQGNLEESDIESAFNSLIRIYKSGKYYLLRTNVKNNKDDTPAVKIYNEKEMILNIEDVTPETEIISILEIQGIKFTSRNFQIEIELKQVMVLDNDPIFAGCLIKTNKKIQDKSLEEIKEENLLFITDNEVSKKDLTEDITNDITKDITKDITEEDKFVDSLESLDEIENIEILSSDKMLYNEEKKNEENFLPEEPVNIEFEDLVEDIQENTDVLREIDDSSLNLDKSNSFMTLKKPNQVYFDLYKEAKKKAKEAKKNAILAYLEAKNIKKTYIIENMNDSDSDFDAEIDEVSESELEGL